MQCVVIVIFISILNLGTSIPVAVNVGDEKTEQAWLSFRATWMFCVQLFLLLWLLCVK